MEQTASPEIESRLFTIFQGYDSVKKNQALIGHSDDFMASQAKTIVTMEHISEMWAGFADVVNRASPTCLHGPILDLGCGRGNLVYHGLTLGLNVFGVDVDEDGIDFFRQRVSLNQAPGSWANRCMGADGEEMPFESNFFTAVHSNYVLEHMPSLGEILRETVRVTRPGGIIYLKAQDARIHYEGHYQIPWLPFMPKHQASIWLDEFDKPDGFLDQIYYHTTPEVTAILEALGCQILGQGSPPATILPNHWQIKGEDELRSVAHKCRELYETGQWPKQPGSLVVFARKSTS